jgi:predicted outer membrane protein
MRVATLVLGAMAATTLAACSTTSEAPRERSGSRATARGPVVVRPLFAADYMAMASSIDLYEIRSSELALTRAQNPRHRDFARAMIAAHKGTSSQLSFAGRRLNLLPSATLLPAHQAMLDELNATGDFDAAYHRQQIAVHQAALKLHSDFAARGESATLRPVAKNAAAIVRRHLDMMRRM